MHGFEKVDFTMKDVASVVHINPNLDYYVINWMQYTFIHDMKDATT